MLVCKLFKRPSLIRLNSSEPISAITPLILKTEIKDGIINVLVTAKDGIDELRESNLYQMVNVWIDCDICERFLRIGKRNNLEYSLERIEKDGFRRNDEITLAHHIIDTTTMTEEEMVAETLKILTLANWI